MDDRSPDNNPASDSSPSAFLTEQWKAYVDLQKQSADIFFKSVVLYLGLVSVAIGFILKDSPTGGQRRLLAIFIFVASANTLLGCRHALAWAKSLNERLSAIELDLNVRTRFPGDQLAKFVHMAMVGTSIVMAGALVEIWYAFHF